MSQNSRHNSLSLFKSRFSLHAILLHTLHRVVFDRSGSQLASYLFDFTHVDCCIASRPRAEPAVLRVEDYFDVNFDFLVLFDFIFG